MIIITIEKTVVNQAWWGEIGRRAAARVSLHVEATVKDA
jgi:hypothetical protein